MAEWKYGAPVLPVQLTEGVTATREGLWITDTEPVRFMFPSWDDFYDGRLISWDDAAERLRYQEGEPWCTSSDGAFTRDIVCHSGKRKPSGLSGYIFGEPIKDNPLHRLAAILCDGAEEFRVLHWCVHHLATDSDT